MLAADLEEICRKEIPGYNPWDDEGDCKFYPEPAQQAIDFFSVCLKHVEGELAGKSLQLEIWQQAIIANLFGWKHPDGRRRYREAFILVGRRNGKTTMAAGLILLVLFGDHEIGAQIYSAAADRDQATLIFKPAKAMVMAEPWMSSRVKIYEAAKSIVYTEENSSYKAISAEANTKHGYNSHLVVIDELHAQPNRALVDVLLTSTGSRRQPLVVHITTSDYDRDSICNEKYDYACKVRDRIEDDRAFLPVIYEALREDDWTDPKVWVKANPNLGISISQEYLERECKRAQNSPAFENTFKRLHLNIKTEQAVRWLPLERWDQCGGALDPADLVGRECYAGLDLASTTDLAALALLFPRPDGFDVLSYFWLPADRARENEERGLLSYTTWGKQGYLTLTPGNRLDFDFIRKRINELGREYNIQEIAIDRWNATQLANQLKGDGFSIQLFGQGYASMSAPAKELEALVLGKQINHGGDPVVRWMASNVSITMDAAGNIKPARDKSADKIDIIVAIIMALGRAMLRPDSEARILAL